MEKSLEFAASARWLLRRLISALATRSRPTSNTTAACAAHMGRRARMELLDDRRLLAVAIVDTLADTVDLTDGRTSLREAIFAANTLSGPDEIAFASSLFAARPGKIVLRHGEMAVTDGLTIRGPGPDLLTIDAREGDLTPEVNDNAGSRIFHFLASEEFSLRYEVSGMSLTGGEADFGGAILSAAPLTLRDMHFEDNFAGLGGGAVSSTEPLEIFFSRFVDNVSRSGGAVFANVETIESSLFERNQGEFGGAASLYGSLTSSHEASIRDSVFRANTGMNGGAVFSKTVNPLHIVESLFEDNFAGYGGAIHSLLGRTEIESSRITSNAAYGSGGGVFVDSGSLVVSRSEIGGNSAGSPQRGGGGVFVFSPAHEEQAHELTIIDSRLQGNYSAGNGGGVYWSSHRAEQYAQIVRSTVEDNSALGNGGGIYAGLGMLAIESSIVSHNTAVAASGGGVASFSGALEVDSSLISRNLAGDSGGGVAVIRTSGGSLASIRNSTFAGNAAPTGGGAVKAVAIEVENSTMSGNRSSAGSAINAVEAHLRHSTVTLNDNWNTGGAVSILADVIVLDHTIVAQNPGANGFELIGEVQATSSLIGYYGGGSLAETPGEAPDANGNLVGGRLAGRIDPRLAALESMVDSPSPGLERAPVHQLLPGSRAIDAGDRSFLQASSPIEFDQRGAPYARVGGDRIDIGAVEFQDDGGVLSANFVDDASIDGADLLIWQRNLGIASGAGRSMGDATQDGDVDIHDWQVWFARFGEAAPRAISTDAIAGANLAAQRATSLDLAQRNSRYEFARTPFAATDDRPKSPETFHFSRRLFRPRQR